MKHLIIRVGFVAAALLQCAGSETAEEANRILSAVRGIDGLTALTVTARRTSTAQGQRLSDEWTFRYMQPDRIRVDYADPRRRIILINGDTITEYIPEAGKAMVTSLDKLSAAERRSRVASALSRVAVMGLRAGDFAAMAEHATAIVRGTDGTLTVRGSDPRFEIVVDSDRRVILSSRLFDTEGRLKVQTLASDFVRLSDRVWFPRRVKTRHRADAAVVESTIRFTRIQPEVPRPKKTFVLALPEGTEILSGN